MITKEFEAANATRSILITLFKILIILLIVAIPIADNFFDFQIKLPGNLMGLAALLLFYLLPTMSFVRKYSIDRQHFYIHRLIGRKKIDLQGLLDVRKQDKSNKSNFSLSNIMKNSDILSSIFNQNKKKKRSGDYESYVTDPGKIVFLIFKDKKIAVSPEYQERFIGYIRNYISYKSNENF
jgi:hypothetical protein